ncbi:family 10 glycosylhydrolase [Paenibacillus sp. P96]|uniref:Family 10 glycosylhydrolase n=1 Tax=Paenibacillus zeirhizosphaerae TaxID=2987519 RepID=A0ABT9FQQ2_9BACL|nr:family 10 glycosylhydrolase [Paenibacillus sp. P96]MDP4096762.1 family 10 glycosylhydrolase [Paenibacillus sp. P96]
MKRFKWLIMSLLVVLTLQSGAWQVLATPSKDITIYLDGAALETDVSPYIKQTDNVTMVPLRVISQGLSAQVAWSQPTSTVTINGNGKMLSMTTGAGSALVDGATVQLDSSVEMRNGRVMVPLRFIGEQLGLEVNWDRSARTITLLSGASAPAPGEPAETGDEVSASESMRGAWVSTVNGDWPSTKNSVSAQQQEFSSMLDDLAGMGINAVFVQVRASADAIYPSNTVPWSKYLTNVQGKSPGYDPLAFMIEETHKRGMEFHAWFNPFRANTSASSAGLADNHVAVQHPDWIVNTGAQLYINPGIPAARQQIIDDIMEVVNQYDIDGVHLDDYFYPYSGTFNDDSAYASYNDGGLNKGDWRRDNTNRFVQELGAAVHAANPDLQFGISPFGVWRNKADDITGSDTRAGVTAYGTTYADVRKWIKEDWVDYVAPQIYWSIGYTAAAYDKLVSWWSDEVEGTNVKLYVGHSPYKLGTSEQGWQTAQQIIDQLQWNENYTEVKGDIFFSAQYLRKNPLGLISLLQSYYHE